MATLIGRLAVKTEQHTSWSQIAIAIVLPVLAIFSSLVVWVATAQTIDVARFSDIGIITALPPASLAALGLLTVSFALTLRHGRHHIPLLILHILALIFMLYGLSSLVEEQPRFAVTWLHEGFTEYVVRNGQIDPGLDGRFNWPGFFVMSAFIQQVSGVESLIPLIMWAPVLLNVLYLTISWNYY